MTVMHVIRAIICILPILWAAAGVYPQQPPDSVMAPENQLLAAVTVTGIDSTTAGVLEDSLLSRAGDTINEGLIVHDIEAITAYMHANGWLSAAVAASADTTNAGITLVFTVTPGGRAYFGTQSVHVEDGGEDAGLSIERSSEPFTRDTLEAVVQGLINDFTGLGFPDVAVTPAFSARGDTLDVVYSVLRGERAVVDTVVINGLDNTRPEIILRELEFVNNAPVEPDLLASVEVVLARFTIVTVTEQPYISFDRDGICRLVVTLAETRQGSFDGVLGYQPGEDNGNGSIIGTVQVAHNNLFGTGRAANVRWENLGKNTEDMEVAYTEPWIFGKPYDVTGTFLQEERGALGYTRTQITMNVGRYIGRLRLSGGWRYEKVSADSLASTKANGIEGSLEWVSLDNLRNPRSGIRYAARWARLARTYTFGAEDDTSMERLEFDLHNHIPVYSRQSIALALYYRRIYTGGGRIEPADKYWLGGASTIRGYRERFFPAVEAVWGTLEYRFITGNASRFFLFTDSGWLVDRLTENGATKELSDNRTGYGFGFRIGSEAGTLGFDYGLADGDSPADGKLHVRLRTEF